MPRTKNPLIRYLALDKCLRDGRKRYYIADLVDACQKALYNYDGSSVEERTVRQDLTDMARESLYAAPIKRHMDGHMAWYRYSDLKFSIQNLPMSQAEMNLLSDTINMLSRFSGLPKYEWMNEIFVRFENTFQMKGNTGNAVCFAQNINLRGLQYFTMLFEAIIAKKVLHINYAKFGKSPKTFEVHPYQLKQYNNRWFLIGMVPTCQQQIPLMNFPLDRIVDIEVVNGVIYQEYNGIDIDDYFKDIVGVSVDVTKVKEKIKLKFYHPAADYVTTKPIHSSQKIIESSESSLILELEMKTNYELETILLSYADNCEILEPSSLRDAICTRAAKILEINKK